MFFCCCGIDTSTVAGSASQVYQQEENDDLDDIDVDEYADEYDDEDSDIDDYDDSLESSDFDSDEFDEDKDTEDEEGSAITYVLNTNTGKFHYPDCQSVKLMKDKNKLIEETTREDLIERGYDPCGNCNP